MEAKYEANLEFARVQNKKPLMEGVWIFSGTAQFNLLSRSIFAEGCSSCLLLMRMYYYAPLANYKSTCSNVSLFSAQHQGTQHHYGGARPKDKQNKSPSPPGNMKPDANEQTDEGNFS